MDEIEASLVLPDGALGQSSYARYYTEFRGMILGAYTTEVEVRPSDFGCSEVTLDYKLKDGLCPRIADLAPGSRRWVKFRDFPAIGGKQCLAVQMVYDPIKKAFDYVECSKPTH